MDNERESVCVYVYECVCLSVCEKHCHRANTVVLQGDKSSSLTNV